MTPLLVSLCKIWDKAPHSALTDLIYYQDQFLCAFRESDSHVGGRNGVICVLQSSNAVVWNLVSSLEVEGWDLRDPKLSIMPDGRLMLLVGASKFNRNRQRTAHQSLVCFSTDAVNWTSFISVGEPEEWLWRVTWFQGSAYGIAYYFEEPHNRKGEWRTRLYHSENGILYEKLTDFEIPGRPNESTLRFLPSGQLIALIRRDGTNDNHAWIGTSFPPYEDWLWSQTTHYFGGPNFLILPEREMWAAGRIMTVSPYGQQEKTVLAEMTMKDIKPVLTLPSGGDCSYPGLVFQDPYLWISYYSSHEGKAAIYLAKISMR